MDCQSCKQENCPSFASQSGACPNGLCQQCAGGNPTQPDCTNCTGEECNGCTTITPAPKYTGGAPTSAAGLASLQSWFKLSTTPPSGYQTVYNSTACQGVLSTLYTDATEGVVVTSDIDAYSGACFAPTPWYDTDVGRGIILLGAASVGVALIYVAILRAK